MSKLINKLVKASGGWESFLYQTLKEVCDELAPAGYDAGVGGVVDEARDVLKAYEELAKDRWVDQSRKHNGKPTPVIKTQTTAAVEVDEKVQPTKDKTELTKPVESKPKPVPRMMKIRVAVDKDAGASQGALPVPFEHRIVNRRSLFVTTLGGIELGRGSADGQVRGQGVSGHVKVDGVYRFVFTDVNLGVGMVHFEVIQNGQKEEK